MTWITRELHDQCVALCTVLRDRDPALTARVATSGAWLMDGTPEQALHRDLLALNGVAGSFATGVRPNKSDLQRVAAIMEREIARTGRATQ